ncbi:MAG: hypothetical protein ACE5FI_10985 [Anaerolineales bacterium]
MRRAAAAPIYVSVFCLSAGTLLFEIGLTRLFSVAQFYHFAFMLVSLALLGFGVGGALLASAPPLAARLARPHAVAWLGVGFAASAPASYAVINFLPFDSFQITWDATQVGLLALNFLALAVPFSLVGLAVGALLAAQPARAHRLYASNLLGSAAGAALALRVPVWFGGEGIGWGAAWLGALAAAAAGVRSKSTARGLAVAVLALAAAALARPPDALALRLSPFKPLSRAQALPDAETVVSEWTDAARLDVLTSSSLRMLPGVSTAFQGSPPLQSALYVDGDAPMPISRIDRPAAEAHALADHLSQSIGYVLRGGARVLVIEPGGGLDVLAALAFDAAHVTATYAEPRVPALLRGPLAEASGGLLNDPRVSVVGEHSRAFLQRSRERYDVIVLALTDPNRPVTAGAYSLAEDYTLTVEAARAMLSHLDEGGVLVVSRWLQSPPSETLRTYALLLAALGPDIPAVGQPIVGLRGFQHATFAVQPDGFSAADWERVQAFAQARRFDLIVGPGLTRAQANRFNVLPEPVYYDSLLTLQDAQTRGRLFTEYEFDLRPPTDNHPYFFHFFRWQQAPQVLATLGQAWLPFGGSGYLMLVLLLALATAFALLLALTPLAFRGRMATSGAGRPAQWGAGSTAAYFAALGLGFLLIEIPLAQRFTLFLGRPVYGLALVIAGVLAFSGLGSITARRWDLHVALAALVALALLAPLYLPFVFDAALGRPLAWRMLVGLLVLAPLGLLLGVPFAAGLAQLETTAPQRIGWAWAINGSASVVSAVLAPLLSLSFGFNAVLLAGAACYLGALSVARVKGTKRTSRMR